MFSYGNLLTVAAGLMIFVTISAVFGWRRSCQRTVLGRAHCDHPAHRHRLQE